MNDFRVSASAVKRVPSPLPVPTCCPNCGSKVERINNSLIYGREFGRWPWAYRCIDSQCDSYVGMHPKTDIPLGTLANKATRAARKKAKSVFNPMWESRQMTRSEAYAWLANELGIERVEECHIGWFDITTCERVFQICTSQHRETA